MNLKSLLSSLWVASTLALGFKAVKGFGSRFFDPTCAHNDLRQQGFQFYRANHPEIFSSDLIYDSMRAYLPPLHYWLGSLLTYPSDNPMLTAHFLMSIQLLITCVAIFGIVYRLSGLVPGCIALALFLNARSLLLLNAGGLARGWIAPVLSIYLYLAVSSFKSNEWRIWLWMFVSSLLNPVATFISLLAQSFLHLTHWLTSTHKKSYVISKLLPFGMVALVIVATVSFTTRRSPELGKMATLEQASKLQGFSKLGGRFPILPFSDPWHEFQAVGLQVFIGTWRNVSQSVREILPEAVILLAALTLAAIFIAIKRGRKFSDLVPIEIAAFGLAIAVGYFLSRKFAFALYIPDRYLGMPLGLFWVVLVPVLGARIFKFNAKHAEKVWRSNFISGALLIAFLSAFAPFTPVKNGEQMFDVCYAKQSELWDFLQSQTASQALIAGHPSLLDGVQLFGMRKAFITTETAHPFYDAYYAEVKRRMVVVFSAYYAQDWQTFYDLLAAEKIDYFVFRTSDFKPGSFNKERYEIPYFNLLKRLNSSPLENYVYSKLPEKLDPEHYPFFVFRTLDAAVIDVAKLGAVLNKVSKDLK